MKPDFATTWDAQADEFNKWDALGEDEKLCWAFTRGLERAAEITDTYVGLDPVSAAIRSEMEKTDE